MALLRLRRSNGGSRTGKHRSTTDPTYESRIQAGLQGLVNGLYKSVSAAAKAQNVSRTTLSDRKLATHQSRTEAQVKKQILTPAQEHVLAEWCETSSAAANPVHPVKLRAQAKELSGQFPSRNWPRSFLRRHPSLLVARPHNLDPKRAQNFNRTTVGEFFDMQKPLNNVPPQQRWNTDEKGNQMGGGRQNNGLKYIFTEGDTNRYRIHSDNLELVTILECVNAAGDKMPPWFVHKHGQPPDIRHLEDKVGGVSFSESGWTDREVAAFWFEHHFIPHAEKLRVDPNQPIVLYLDGHDSHETNEFKAIAYKYGIVVCAFPSKTTHKLQPLDVGVFGAVQRAWTKHCDKRLAEGVRIDRYNFIHEYMSIQHVITPELVQKAFRNTGLYPLDPSVFTDKDFAPSHASSNTAHVPSSYPVDVPSSPISAASHFTDTDMDDPDFDPMMVEEDLDDDSEMDVFVDGHESPEDDPSLALSHDPGRSVMVHSPGPSQSQSNEHLSSPTPLISQADSEHPLVHTGPPRDHASEPGPPLCGKCSNQIRTGMDTRSTSTASVSPSPSESGSPVILTFAQSFALPKEEVCRALQQSYQQNLALLESNRKLQAQLDAANAHCTLSKWEISETRLQLDNAKKSRPRQSVKVRARFVTASQLKEDFDKAEADRKEKERVEAEKQAKKKADEGARQSQIEHNIRNKTFDSLSTFRRKDDYVTLAGALEISREGTIEELKTRIKDYLNDPSHADVAQNPRFAALFQVQAIGKTRTRNPPQSTQSLEPTRNPDPQSNSHFTPQVEHDIYDTYGTYDHFSPHNTYSTSTHFSHYHTLDASQVASSSNLDRQPQYDVNAGINSSIFSLSNTHDYTYYSR